MNGSSTKYFINNRHHYTHRWLKRNFDASYEDMKATEELPNPAAKTRKATETGYTGLSVLARLNPLYGFDIFKDLVHDVMHLVCLNMTRKLFRRIFDDDHFNIDGYEEELKNFPFTTGNPIFPKK